MGCRTVEAGLVRLVLLGPAGTSEPNWLDTHNHRLLAAQKNETLIARQFQRLALPVTIDMFLVKMLEESIRLLMEAH